MATISSSDVTEHVRFLPFLEETGDGALLDQFITTKDDAAFAELVRRHASMVLGVCRRVLHNAHDAEDCFQAAFLVLVRKAETIQPRAMVGNWLYGVAYRTALEARKLAARRRNMERKKPAPMAEDERAREQWNDLGPLLDQELNRLPDKYRAAVVACDLEGKTREEAARALGLPEGTVASRLARGRALLAKRLQRYSLSMTSAGVALLLMEHASAEVPEALLSSTIDAGTHLAAGQPTAGHVSRNVASLADAVVRGFLIAKLKLAGAALAVLFALGVMVGVFLPSVQAERKFGFKNPRDEKTALVPKKPKRAIDCIVQKIDKETQTIEACEANVACAGDEPVRYQLRVTPETRVVIDGRAATLADLRIGAAVDLEWTEANGTRTAVLIDAVGTWIDGSVRSANGDSVTIEADRKMYDVDKDASVIVNGKKTKLSELKAKTPVKVKVVAGKPRVDRIDVVAPKDGVKVKKVDVSKKTIELEGVAEAITVADDAPVIIAGSKGTLDQLKAGMPVTVRMSAQVGPARVVAIRSETKP